MEIKILKKVMIKNDAIGNDNRKLFNSKKIFTLNITSSPGAGKTTLLENLLPIINDKYKTAVIEGDLYTARDAERISKTKIPVVQINTEGGCHLDARMICEAVKNLDIENLDLIFIENVGNLVCPSAFDLGEHLRVLLYSITEGDDKPKKYETMFSSSDIVLINKVELAPICEIDLDSLEKEILEVNPKAKVFRISAKKKESLYNFIGYLDETISQFKKV